MQIKQKKKSPLIKTINQARRLIKIVIGFTIALAGIVMLVTPGPGIATIVAGLAILATEYVWAQRLLKRFKKEAINVKNHVVNNFKNGKKDTLK
ncbi:MAG: PGPGW domain-containing protein [Nitrospira sp.]|nr:PGPGW domain-containing protein [bacterium]MBL7049903.1 PGPGW domain-containing protein [Nitrospira sp.]